MESAHIRLESLISAWVTTPDMCDILDLPLSDVRRMIDERDVIGVRRGKPKVFMVPRDMIDPEPIPMLKGTLTVLQDNGFDDAEMLVWLFSEDDSLPGTPMANLRAGRRAEVRRRAQALLL